MNVSAGLDFFSFSSFTSKALTQNCLANLEKKDLFGKSDPFLTFQAYDQGSWVSVGKTDFIKQELNPVWGPIELSIDRLCGGDFRKNFKIQCFDWNTSRKYHLIGEASVNHPFFSFLFEIRIKSLVLQGLCGDCKREEGVSTC